MTLIDSRVYVLALGAFFYDPSLKPVAPPLLGRSKPHLNKASMGSKTRYLQCLSVQWRLRISRQSMNRHSSKWPTVSLYEVTITRFWFLREHT